MSSSKVISFHAKPTSGGKVTFRAYAFDVPSGMFSPLAGAFTAEVP